jgi:lysophospholipase L1-like esterase
MRIPTTLLLALLPSLPTLAAPLTLPATDPKIQFTGRTDTRDPAGPRIAWSHSFLTLRFHGTALSTRLTDSGNNYYAVIIDPPTPRNTQSAPTAAKPTDSSVGSPPIVLHPPKGTTTITLAQNLPDADHTLQIIRRTEANQSPTQFHAFTIDGQNPTLLTPPPLPTRKIEVIGDSISCGYGNESPSEKIHFLPKDENALETYGALAARDLNAQYVCIAWSGRKMSPNNTIPEIYDLTLPTDKTSTFDFSKDKPADAVLINLGTNDFGAKENPDETTWTAAYEQFVHHVRATHPTAIIYLASGPMMSDAWPPERKTLSTLKRYLTHIQSDLQKEGDTRIRLLHFPPQDAKTNGLGGDYHPSLKTHHQMADQFKQALQSDLGWN